MYNVSRTLNQANLETPVKKENVMATKMEELAICPKCGQMTRMKFEKICKGCSGWLANVRKANIAAVAAGDQWDKIVDYHQAIYLAGVAFLAKMRAQIRLAEEEKDKLNEEFLPSQAEKDLLEEARIHNVAIPKEDLGDMIRARVAVMRNNHEGFRRVCQMLQGMYRDANVLEAHLRTLPQDAKDRNTREAAKSEAA